MTDILFPDFAGKTKTYTKTTIGEPYERGSEPVVILSPIDVLALQVWAEAMDTSPCETPPESA